MRLSFNAIDIDGVVVIGEGEKDKAPMLYNGEEVGTKKGPEMDVAVDPVEGTRLLAYGRPNAISVVSIAPKGTMFDPGPAFYMKKLVVGTQAKDVVDIDAPVADTLKAVARELGRSIAFEASVAGGIPIITSIGQCLSANQIQSLRGILNGTSNFIVSQMEERGIDYGGAVAEAQRRGRLPAL